MVGTSGGKCIWTPVGPPTWLTGISHEPIVLSPFRRTTGGGTLISPVIPSSVGKTVETSFRSERIIPVCSEPLRVCRNLCKMKFVAERPRLFQAIDYIEVGEDTSDRIGIGFPVRAELEAGDTLHARRIGRGDFFPKFAMARRDIDTSDLDGNGRSAQQHALAAVKEAHDAFVGIRDDAEFLWLSTRNRVKPTLTLAVHGQEKFAVGGNQASGDALGRDCARSPALYVEQVGATGMAGLGGGEHNRFTIRQPDAGQMIGLVIGELPGLADASRKEHELGWGSDGGENPLTVGRQIAKTPFS